MLDHFDYLGYVAGVCWNFLRTWIQNVLPNMAACHQFRMRIWDLGSLLFQRKNLRSLSRWSNGHERKSEYPRSEHKKSCGLQGGDINIFDYLPNSTLVAHTNVVSVVSGGLLVTVVQFDSVWPWLLASKHIPIFLSMTRSLDTPLVLELHAFFWCCAQWIISDFLKIWMTNWNWCLSFSQHFCSMKFYAEACWWMLPNISPMPTWHIQVPSGLLLATPFGRYKQLGYFSLVFLSARWMKHSFLSSCCKFRSVLCLVLAGLSLPDLSDLCIHYFFGHFIFLWRLPDGTMFLKLWKAKGVLVKGRTILIKLGLNWCQVMPFPKCFIHICRTDLLAGRSWPLQGYCQSLRLHHTPQDVLVFGRFCHGLLVSLFF